MIVTGVVVLAFIMGVVPIWRVWQQRLVGEAQLARAENARQVQVIQARAEKEAAQLRADAIAIIGKAAQEFPEYRTQEFIGAFAEALKEGKITQIMYVPTEANIPITEAGRRPAD
jgi:regulator of protease activity HflC (stomatin/prohibitin superfamily)